jgi:tetratricopeptide (TPR) repeat protein
MELLDRHEKYYINALNLVRDGRFLRASMQLKIADKYHFDKGKVLLLQGIIELYKMNVAKAFELFQRVLTFTSKSTDVYYYIGKCFLYFGNEEEAFDNFIKAYKLSPNELIKGKSNIELLKLKHIEPVKLEKVLSQKYSCLVKINQDIDTEYRSKALEFFIKGEPFKGVELLKKLIDKQPRNFEAFKDMAYGFSQMSNFEFALKSLKKAKSICPADKSISIEKAKVLFSLEKYYEAKSELKKTIKNCPPNYKNFYNMGNICSLTGRTTEAVSYYKKSFEINENFSDAYFNIATIYHSEGMLDQGEKYYNLAKEINPSMAEVHYNLGILKYFKRDYFEALNHNMLAYKIDPGYENAIHNFKVIKNVKLLHQDEDFNERVPFNTKVIVTFTGIIVFLIIAYIVRVLNP